MNAAPASRLPQFIVKITLAEFVKEKGHGAEVVYLKTDSVFVHGEPSRLNEVVGGESGFVAKAGSSRGPLAGTKKPKKMVSSAKLKKHEEYMMRMFDSEYPFFISEMHPNGLCHSHTMYVPASFAHGYSPGCPYFVNVCASDERK
ncbi:hypothetical protein ACH5RR_036183 [Cinchona calisaya]|uniref:Uncharacterized protein n=1 Tax=Cinchona calisaya TaxID=153742 RepID=A0ABD2Y2G6_9GENT